MHLQILSFVIPASCHLEKITASPAGFKSPGRSPTDTDDTLPCQQHVFCLEPTAGNFGTLLKTGMVSL